MIKKYSIGILVLIGSSALFSIMLGLVRYASYIDSFKTSLFRFAVGLALLGTAALSRKIKLTFIRRKLLFLRGLFGGAGVFFLYLSVSKIGISKGTVISYSFPIFATIGSALFLREKIELKKWFAIFFAFVGIYLISTSRAQGLFGFGMYEVLAVIGAVCGGTAIVLVRKLRETDSSYAIFFAQCSIGFWLVIIPANIVSSKIGIIGGLILLAIGITAAVAQLMMTYAYRYVPVSTGSLITMLVPVFNIPVGIIGFNEVISRKSLIGMIIILLSCVFVLARGKNR